MNESPPHTVRRIRRGSQETGGRQTVDHFLSDRFGFLVVVQLVARELLGQEEIVRFVVVQGTNHVVSVSPSKGARLIGVTETLRVRITCKIEPMTTPALAVVGRFEEPVNQPAVGVGSGIGHVCASLGGSRLHADEIQIGPAQQDQTIGFGREG